MWVVHSWVFKTIILEGLYLKTLLPGLVFLLLTACAQTNLNWPGYMCSDPWNGVLTKQFASPQGIVLPAGTKVLVSGCDHGDSTLVSFRVDRWDSEYIVPWEPEHPNSFNFYTLGTSDANWCINTTFVTLSLNIAWRVISVATLGLSRDFKISFTNLALDIRLANVQIISTRGTQ